MTTYREYPISFCNPGYRDEFDAARKMFDELIDKSTEDKQLNANKKRKHDDENNSADVEGHQRAISSLTGKRCSWASDPVLHVYHDEEWGVPSHDDRYLFEMLILEGAQAGLSWKTILNKRDNYRAAFDNFDVDLISNYDQQKIDDLLVDPGIVRNRLKIHATIGNAKATIRVREEFGSLAAYLWQFIDNTTINNSHHITHYKDIPATSIESDMISKDMKRRGFKFVGSTIIYAFMQAVGMVNDHEKLCPQNK